MTADREIQPREVSDDRLGGLGDYYLNRLDGQGDMEDLFAHLAWQRDALDQLRAERDTLYEVLGDFLDAWQEWEGEYEPLDAVAGNAMTVRGDVIALASVPDEEPTP